MATAFAHIQNDVTCSLCLDLYYDPKILACGHSFCKSCLQNHINTESGDSSFLCPACRKTINIPGNSRVKSSWADQFPGNITLTNVISTMKITKIKQKGDDVSPQTEPLKTISKSVKYLECILIQNMESEIERIRRDLNDVAERSAREIDQKMDELTQSVQDEGNKLKAELKKSQQNIENEIPDHFEKQSQLIDAGEQMIKFGECLLADSSADEIRKNISIFIKQQQITSDFLSKVKQGDTEVLEIRKANIKSELKTKSVTLDLK